MNIGENSHRLYYKVWYKGENGRYSCYLSTYDLDDKYLSIAEAEKALETTTSWLVNKEEHTWRKRTMEEKRGLFEIHEFKEEITRVR